MYIVLQKSINKIIWLSSLRFRSKFWIFRRGIKVFRKVLLWYLAILLLFLVVIRTNFLIIYRFIFLHFLIWSVYAIFRRGITSLLYLNLRVGPRQLHRSNKALLITILLISKWLKRVSDPVVILLVKVDIALIRVDELELGQLWLRRY